MDESKLRQFVQLESAVFVIATAFLSWLIYRFFMRSIAPHRHRNLSRLFSNLFFHSILALGFFALYMTTQYVPTSPFDAFLGRISSYVGLLTLVWGLNVLIKTSRIFAFEYLFLKHMREGVPLLLVNLLTLMLSGVLIAWVLNQVFNIQLAPVLATSAVFSLVLGLALQDTLGNLFAGVALQFDKPFDLGDWIEVQYDTQKFIGMVSEISWRATVLIGFLEEVQTIPNRTISSAHITNYSGRVRPVLRSQVFRIGFQQDSEKVKSVLLDSIKKVPGVRQDPRPVALVIETTESFATYKLIYSLDDFSTLFITGDKVIRSALDALNVAGIPLAPNRLELVAKN
jgi:small-conductance mechanosensitive channel